MSGNVFSSWVWKGNRTACPLIYMMYSLINILQVAELVEDVSKTVGELDAAASLCSSVLPLANLVREKKCIEPSYANKTYCIEIVEL